MKLCCSLAFLAEATLASARRNRLILNQLILPVGLLFFLLLAVMPVEGATYVNRDAGGTVRDVTLSSTTWTAANSPYIVEATLTVGSGATLAIEAGASVQVSENRGLYVNGTMAATNVSFTINGTGYWLGIYLSPDAGGSVLRGCTVSKAGANNLGYFNSDYRRTAIYVNGCAATIVNCTIADSAGHGIELWPNQGTVQNNTIQNLPDWGYAIVYDAVAPFPSVAGNSFAGSGIGGVWVARGTVADTNRWNNPGANLPYYLDRELVVADGGKLIIDPGTIVKSTGARFTINGTLDARGTAAQPIVLTSRNANAAPGDWLGIYFGPKAGNSFLDYVTVAFAGQNNMGYFHGDYRFAAIYVDSCSPAFDHLTVSSSQFNGVEMYASSTSLSHADISSCGGHGLKAEAASRPTVSNVRFAGNGANGNYTVGTDASSVPTPANITFVTNAMQGVQIWGGTLAADAQWKNWSGNAPYVVTADITVSDKTALAVEQGTTVKFQNCGFFVNGTLTADGDPATITFTSWRDDTAGGDTNGDSAKTAPAPSDWKGIYLASTSVGSRLNNCGVRYAGANNLIYVHGNYRLTSLYVDGAAVTITNCAIANSGGHGLELWASTSTVRNNRFQDIAGGYYAVVYDSLSAFPVLGGNSVSGTGILGISVPGGTVGDTNTWNKPGPDFPFFLDGEVSLAEGAWLTLEPGVTVKSAGKRMLIYGTLKALGTAAEPIVFTSRNDSPTPGNWLGIYFGAQAGDSVLSHVTVAYAGQENLTFVHGTYRTTAIHVDSCSPQLDHLTVANSKWNGLELWASQSTINDLVIRDCGSYALTAESQSNPVINRASFSGNGINGDGYYTIGMDASSVPLPANAAFMTNRLSGIRVWGGTLGNNGLWRNWAANAPYVITEDATVGAGARLAIEQGVTVKFKSSGLYVNGALTASGDPGRITFTSWLDDLAGGDSNGDGTNSVPAAADWKGIYLAPAAGSSVFNNCAFRYAGRNNLLYIHGNYRLTTIYVDGCSPPFTNCRVTDSAGNGIEFWSSSSVVQNSQFANFGSGAYALAQDTLDCHLQLSGNTLSGGAATGIYLPGGTIGTDVTLNNPGTGFAYVLAGELNVSQGITLTIDPGVVCKTSGQRVMVYGSLRALGTAASPIVFTSSKDAPAPGDWLGIYFAPTAVRGILSYVTVAYAGRESLIYINGAYQSCGIYVDNCSPQFDHVTVSQSKWNGIQFWASRSLVNNLTADANGSYGLMAEAGSRPIITDASFTGNGFMGTGYYSVGMDGSSVPVPTAVNFATNKMQGVRIWGGSLWGDGLWKNWNTNAPYVITEDVSVNANVNLTIEPGTTIKFQTAGLYVNGTIYASGDPARITFTSARDDSVAGDTNGDTTNSLAAAGDWKGIYLAPGSDASVFDNCLFRYAGRSSLGYYRGDYRSTTLYLDDCSPAIANCDFADSGVHGVELWSSSAHIQDTHFNNMAANGYALVFDTMDSFPLLSANSAGGTGLGGIAIPGGSIGGSGAWSKAGTNFPYFLNNDVSVSDTGVLRIEPGALIQSGGPGLYVSGILLAVGTAAEPVVFTGRKPAPTPGDWKGIYFGPNAGGSLMRFCSVANAGAANLGYYNGDYRASAIYVDSGNPELANLTVSQSASYGVTLVASSSQLNNSLIYSNAQSGILLFNGGSPRLVNNTIVYGQSSGIYCYAGTPVAVNNLVAFNKTTGISQQGGALTLRNNCVFGNQTMNYDRLTAGAGDLSSDPKLVNPAAANYRLLDGSPALNAGDSTATETHWMDRDGRLRSGNGPVDIGAFEMGAAMAQHLVDGMVRNSGETVYVGENSQSLADQTKAQTVNAGISAVYQFKIKYNGNLPDDLRIFGDASRKGWTVRYYDALAGGNDITTLLTLGGGWVATNVTAGAALEFRVVVTADATVPGNAVQSLQITAISAGEPTQLDTIRTLTSVAPKAQADLMISRSGDIRYTGEDIYNSDASGQTKIREVEAGAKAVYYLRASNKGNISDSFIFRGSAGGNGWTVRYFDALTGTNEVTALVNGPGWTNTALSLGASAEFRLEVTASSAVGGGSTKEILLTASSSADGTKSDTVKAITLLTTTSATPQGRTYTLDTDFDDNGNGLLVGLEYQTVHDQLQLSKEAVTLPFIWVPNSNESTISKVDTRTGRELGRYRTIPAGVNGDPSRTTVDQQGNCWIVNRRGGSVVKFGLFENGQYEDRNGNGIIETSSDANGEGDIMGAELLDWGKDECALFEVVLTPGYEGTYIPGTYKGPYNETSYPRAVAVDAGGNVWAGAFNTKKYFYIDGNTGKILRTVDVSSANHTPYGAVIDAQGILWSAGIDKNHVLRLDPADNSFKTIDIGHTVYGLGLDNSNHLFISGWQSVRLSRLNVLTGTKDWTVNGINESRGVAVTDDGDVWVANSAPGTVARWSNDGILKDQLQVGTTPTGVSIDSDGKVWVVNDGDEYIKRIDPATDTIDLAKRIIGGLHYGYSDMTGIIARTATTRFGRWTVIHNAKVADTPWGLVSWHGAEPAGTSIKVRLRSSNDQTTWSLWENALNGISLTSTPPGKYLQVETTMQMSSGVTTPVLYDLTVTPAGEVNVGQQVYSNDFQAPPGSEWSSTNVDVAPVGGRMFLGQFGNTNVSLTLGSLPPHSAVTVAFDLFVIRSWDGNNTNDGPDLFDLNVAGGLKLVHGTFNNAPTNSAADGQTYPGSFPSGTYAPYTGATETNTLGFVYRNSGVMDSVYRMSHTVIHSANNLVLNFSAAGLNPDPAEETWGLANVRIFVTPTTTPTTLHLVPLGWQNGDFHVRLVGEAQHTYVMQTSTNLVDWSSVGTNTLSSDSLDWTENSSAKLPRRFYRAFEP